LKVKLSITVEEETVQKLMDGVRSGRFRNKSHAFEYAVKKIVEAPK
jgi:Arc/MetJ-type ribon-helix-helix transcriptional regulator